MKHVQFFTEAKVELGRMADEATGEPTGEIEATLTTWLSAIKLNVLTSMSANGLILPVAATREPSEFIDASTVRVISVAADIDDCDSSAAVIGPINLSAVDVRSTVEDNEDDSDTFLEATTVAVNVLTSISTNGLILPVAATRNPLD